MTNYQNILNLVGRILVVALFLPAGISKLTNFGGTVGYFTSLGIAAPGFTTGAVIAVEILGSIAILLGFRTALASIGLAIFTLIASVIGHAFWTAPADQAFVAQLLFFKNIAVVGGLLILASTGSGKFGIDGAQSNK